MTETQAENLLASGISHGFFGREGGVSTGIYTSLNCGLGSDDARAAVLKNRQFVAETLGTSPDHLITPYQVHSPRAVYTQKPWQPKDAPKADALVTDEPGLAIGVLTADCVPVLFCDPEAKVIGAAHSGWRGAIGGVLDATIEQMLAKGAQRTTIKVAVGPSITLLAYEVGEEFKAEFLAQNPGSEQFFHAKSAVLNEGEIAHLSQAEREKPHFDLPNYVVFRLKAVGMSNIRLIPHCTFGDESRYFSYRRTVKNKQADYGRQISAIMIS